MPVQTKAEIEAQLADAAQRMKRVNRSAQAAAVKRLPEAADVPRPALDRPVAGLLPVRQNER